MLIIFKVLDMVLLLLFHHSNGQDLPTISYISPPIVTSIGSSIQMNCTTLHATEYPVLWVKFLPECKFEQIGFDYCVPVPLSYGSGIIIRDKRLR